MDAHAKRLLVRKLRIYALCYQLEDAMNAGVVADAGIYPVVGYRPRSRWLGSGLVHCLLGICTPAPEPTFSLPKLEIPEMPRKLTAWAKPHFGGYMKNSHRRRYK